MKLFTCLFLFGSMFASSEESKIITSGENGNIKKTKLFAFELFNQFKNSKFANIF